MEQFNMLKQMVYFNKTAFDQGYHAMEILREQNQKMANSLLDQAKWMPEEGKKAAGEWMQVYNKGCNDFKKTVDQSYKNVEDLFQNIGK